jgi:hypothetical protein
MGTVGHRWPDEELVKQVGIKFARKPLYFVSFPTSTDDQNNSLIVTDKVFDGKSHTKLDAIVSDLIHYDPKLKEIYRNSRKKEDAVWDDDLDPNAWEPGAR